MMKCIADPCASQSEGRERLIILTPNFFVLERIHFAEFARQIPRQWINFSALLYILDDDGELRFFFQ
jgi:hypothetical protein